MAGQGIMLTCSWAGGLVTEISCSASKTWREQFSYILRQVTGEAWMLKR